MKNKQEHWAKASFALLIFMILGYVIRFYPQQLTCFDSTIQSTLRGDLSAALTAFFTKVTHVMDTKIIVIWVGLLMAVFAYKKWYSEALLLGSNLVLTGLLVLLLKNIYQRPRPAILHLVVEKGFSFPSGHSLASTLVLGSLIIMIGQRLKHQIARYVLQGVLLLGIGIIVASRVYVGAHYPSDVLGSMILGLAVLQFEYPLYDRLRFQWRFTGKQK
ncbi:phosphatase PAP2 family protein [Streptococcus sp. IMAU 99161]|uniref:phosphatase PAP2 family protein n=1 Tax=Streptococcus sp. IMAU 99161 TaxID=2710601 RepID=UPI0016565FB7|nr:phosphatase PAP2 family protein [Streptococcus sp. IMAU 99161]MBC8776202.1 phosphatase PAP2 family protein [Streptococcus sp. IMAU 99161]